MKRNGEKGRLIHTNHSLTPGFGRLQCNLKRGLQGRRAIICSQINHVSNRAKIPLRLAEAIIIQIIFIRLHCYSDSPSIIQTSCQTSLCFYSACKCYVLMCVPGHIPSDMLFPSGVSAAALFCKCDSCCPVLALKRRQFCCLLFFPQHNVSFLSIYFCVSTFLLYP